MNPGRAIEAFAALSQRTRLETVRLLAAAGAEGMRSGEIGAALGVRANTMSANLTILLGAGLIENRREGRTVRYFVNLDAVSELTRYLVLDCCGGRPEVIAGVCENVPAAPDRAGRSAK